MSQSVIINSVYNDGEVAQILFKPDNLNPVINLGNVTLPYLFEPSLLTPPRQIYGTYTILVLDNDCPYFLTIPRLTPTPTPSLSPTKTQTPTPTPTNTPTPTFDPCKVPTPTPTNTQTQTVTPSNSATPRPTCTNPCGCPEPSNTPKPTKTPKPTQTSTSMLVYKYTYTFYYFNTKCYTYTYYYTISYTKFYSYSNRNSYNNSNTNKYTNGNKHSHSNSNTNIYLNTNNNSKFNTNTYTNTKSNIFTKLSLLVYEPVSGSSAIGSYMYSNGSNFFGFTNPSQPSQSQVPFNNDMNLYLNYSGWTNGEFPSVIIQTVPQQSGGVDSFGNPIVPYNFFTTEVPSNTVQSTTWYTWFIPEVPINNEIQVEIYLNPFGNPTQQDSVGMEPTIYSYFVNYTGTTIPSATYRVYTTFPNQIFRLNNNNNIYFRGSDTQP